MSVIDIYKPEPMSQVHLAEEFVRQHCESWRYCHELKRWFFWDGASWEVDSTGGINRLAIELMRQALRWPEAAGLSRGMKRQLGSWYTVRAVRDLATYDERIIATPEELGYETPPPGQRGVRWKRTRLKP